MIARHKGEIPFVVLLLPFVAGISTGIWLLPVVNTPILVSSFIFSVALFILLNIGYQRLELYRRLRWLGAVLMHIILFTGGWMCSAQYNDLNATGHFSKQLVPYLMVRLNSEPKYSGRYIRFTAVAEQGIVHHNHIQLSGNLLLITPATAQSRALNYGDELLVTADYTPVTPPYNPAEFNYKQYLTYQNIHYQLFANPGKFTLVRKGSGNAVMSYALKLREHLADRLKAGIKDSSAAAVASTLMLGYKADLSNELLQAYSKTGTIHVLSVSGAHVAIIYVLITLLLGFLNRYRYGRILNAFLSILLIWGYSLLTGFSPAVCRAALMISLFIAGRTFYRHTGTLNILAASAFILLLYDPYLLADVGFQLSYLAVFGLFAFQPVIYNLWKIKNKWLQKIWYLCSASIAAQLITFSLSIYYFHQFPVYFLFSNLFIVLPTEIVMIAGMAYLILYPLPYLSFLLGKILEYTIVFMNKGLAWMEHLPYASAGGLWITPTEYLLLFLGIVVFIYFLYSRKALYLSATLLCLLVFAISAGFKKYQAVNSKEFVFFNLRKHSGILFRNGRQGVLLTDIDEQNATYKYSLQPCIDSTMITANINARLNQDLSTRFFRKRGNYIQFLNKSVLLIDSNFKFTPLLRPLTVNYVYVTGTGPTDLDFLSENYVYDTVIADASNSMQAIERLKEQAEKQHKKFICLRRNKSFIVASN